MLIGALVVLIGLAVGGTVLAVNTLTKPADATNAYLRALQRQQFPVAYSHLCDARRRETSRATFVDEQRNRVQTDGAISEFNVYWSFVSSDNHATARYTIDRNLLNRQRLEVDLVRENGTWRLCHFTQLAE